MTGGSDTSGAGFDERVSIVPPGTVAVGMQLPIQSQSTVYVEAWEREAGAPELAAIARAADEAGFFYVAVCDHVAIPANKADAMSTTWYDTFTTLGFLAGVTERIRLLSHVFVPAYRHPLVSAKALLTLDEVSGGRAILGVGAGHVEAEFDVLGIDFATRGRLLDESMDVIRRCLLDEWPDHHGEHFVISGVGLRPRPRQQPRPPIWVGGSSSAAIRRAGERGDGWLPQGNPPKKYPAMIEKLLTHRREAADAAGLGAQPVDIGALCEYVHVGAVPDGLEMGPWSISGPPEAVAEGLDRWTAAGANHLQVRFPSRGVTELCDQIAVFGADVLPLLSPPPTRPDPSQIA